MIRLNFLFVFVFLLTGFLWAQPGQVIVPRIETMPNAPAPYNLRDWKSTAVAYDEFIYDTQQSGQYLPLCFLEPGSVNYPQIPAFRLHTYVGTFSNFGNEAINVLPSLVGATLVGQDKQNQFGQNWVRMSQQFYNKANGENLYLNSPATSSGNDWWYDMMPNVFFYQLYDLYPTMDGEAEVQFISIADQMLAAAQQMGGEAAPWQIPYFNYRAWNFREMTPTTESVPEPEAAGAFAWLLYQAWTTTGNAAYLQGAEWATEFLDEWPTNPSYELQLPYGTLTAARMNAELGTNYNVEKMLNWSFDRGALRGWGTITGSWNGFAVAGLVGEANDNGNDYAFQLNGLQQAAALVPAVRYDKRFARAIGKWMVNLANANRLFYPGFLPASLQDAASWSSANDPQQAIGYEALREQWDGQSPFSTGDALRGGWAATNLALYGTSSVGYLGALVEPTDVVKILQLDLLKTDFFGAAAYPTFLYYNPYTQAENVTLEVGSDPVDIYDALTETFLVEDATGSVSISLPANEARMLVFCPAGGVITYATNKMLVDGVVVDYQQHAQAYTVAPRFKALAAAATPLAINTSTSVYATVDDTDSEQLTYTWSATVGSIAGTTDSIVFTAPPELGEAILQCIATDETGNRDTALLVIPIVGEINNAPQIIDLSQSLTFVAPLGTVVLTGLADDEAVDNLTYSWSASNGNITGTGPIVNWVAPSTAGIETITVTVQDDQNLMASASATVLVRNFVASAGEIIAHYPFTGNPDDVSGNELNGQINGAILTTDPLGNNNNAYYFNGGSQHINVANAPILNFQEGITVSGWIKANALPDRESFVVSHGSWQNRWKVSITPQGHLRWTVNTLGGITDLDLPMPLVTETFYHFAATYDGALMALYLNGELRAFTPRSGLLRTASYPLLLGQMLPEAPEYNFKGVMDEIKIYDHALTPDQINTLYDSGVTATRPPVVWQENTVQLFPNPVATLLHLAWDANVNEPARVEIFDLLGRQMYTQGNLCNGSLQLDVTLWPAGIYHLIWTSSSSSSQTTFSKNQ